MTSRTPQCKVFCPLLSSFEHSRVPEESQPPTFPSVGLHPHTWPKWGCNTFRHSVVLLHIIEKLGCISNWLITFVHRVLCQHGTNCQIGCIYMNMEFQIPTRNNEYWGVNVPLLDGIPCNSTPHSPFKWLTFSKEFGDGGHNKSKVMYETLIKLRHAIEDLDILGGF